MKWQEEPSLVAAKFMGLTYMVFLLNMLKSRPFENTQYLVWLDMLITFFSILVLKSGELI